MWDVSRGLQTSVLPWKAVTATQADFADYDLYRFGHSIQGRLVDRLDLRPRSCLHARRSRADQSGARRSPRTPIGGSSHRPLTPAPGEVLINPRMPADQAARLQSWLSAAEHLSAHVFVLTSGSTAASEADYKWVALSKRAILAAAKASNSHLAVAPNDVWLHCLPDFHVGGMGIRARALLGGNRVEAIVLGCGRASRRQPRRRKATLASLVPAQVHDLVSANLAAPPSIRAILVGGGSLSDDLYLRARDLGWPLLQHIRRNVRDSFPGGDRDIRGRRSRLRGRRGALPRFAPSGSRRKRAGAPHGSRRVASNSWARHGVLEAQTRRRFSGTPRILAEGGLAKIWAEVENGQVRLEGRLKDRIKVGGEMVNLALLRRTWESVLNSPADSDRFALCALPDDRLESVVVLAMESGNPQSAIDRFSCRHAVRTHPKTVPGRTHPKV